MLYVTNGTCLLDRKE